MSELSDTIKLISRSYPAAIRKESPSQLTMQAAAVAIGKAISLSTDAPTRCCDNTIAPGDRCPTCGDKY